MSDFNPRDIAEWMANYCTDVEFVELFTYYDRMRKANFESIETSKEIMELDVDSLSKNINESLKEIISDPEISAWWKEEETI